MRTTSGGIELSRRELACLLGPLWIQGIHRLLQANQEFLPVVNHHGTRGCLPWSLKTNVNHHHSCVVELGWDFVADCRRRRMGSQRRNLHCVLRKQGYGVGVDAAVELLGRHLWHWQRKRLELRPGLRLELLQPSSVSYYLESSPENLPGIVASMSIRLDEVPLQPKIDNHDWNVIKRSLIPIDGAEVSVVTDNAKISLNSENARYLSIL